LDEKEEDGNENLCIDDEMRANQTLTAQGEQTVEIELAVKPKDNSD